MKLTLSAIILFLPFVTPVILQLVFGLKGKKLKLLQVTIANIAILFIGVFLLSVFLLRPATARTHDGLAYLGVGMFLVIAVIVILGIAGVQYLINRKKRI